MLFNSYSFILLFLPAVLLGFHLIGKTGNHHASMAWLVASSLFFYGWWNPVYLGLMLGSMAFNFIIGVLLGRFVSKAALAFGILANIGLLGYYKYANFLLDNFNLLTNSSIHIGQIVLPLAISFFTFQQIAYLIDAYRGLVKEYDFIHYCLFVTFFPQLIAGPIVHHKEMLPQFAESKIYRLNITDFSVGMTIFSLGLFKKVVWADTMSLYASPLFSAADAGVALAFSDAWLGVLAYTLQIYFDFSAYSDMATGLARMFGIVLPVNFFSPYKASNIIDFWRRWHITLSRFLRDCLYIPLGGNRKGTGRRYVNLMVTMLLGGIWHGAGWTFLIWGGLHGLYLVINHGWHYIKRRVNAPLVLLQGRTGILVARGLTFFSVVIAWVLFRAGSFHAALKIYSAMFDIHSITLPVVLQETYVGRWLDSIGIKCNGMFYNGIFENPTNGCIYIALLLIVVWIAPNTMEWMSNELPALGLDCFSINTNSRLKWRPTAIQAVIISLIATYSLMHVSGASEFIYFRF